MNFEPVPNYRSNTIDAPERIASLMAATYRWMALGLALTGLVAYGVAAMPSVQQMVFGNPIMFFGLIIAEFALVFSFSRKVGSVSASTAASMFLGYSLLNGVTMSFIFLAYAHASIAQAFFITAGSFAALSVYGATTKRDLTAMGQFMFVGFIGLFIASMVNIFLKSPAIYWMTTYAGVLIFAGLTAYDNQKLRQLYAYNGGAGNAAISGALTLYLDFVNMFLFVLRLFSDRR